jgi:hypothetical protein
MAVAFAIINAFRLVVFVLVKVVRLRFDATDDTVFWRVSGART